MGHTVIPTYAISYSYVDFANQCLGQAREAWDSKRYGKPTDTAVKQWIADFNNSLRAGGANAHLRAMQSDVSRAKVAYNQVGGAVVAEYSAPMFEVVA